MKRPSLKNIVILLFFTLGPLSCAQYQFGIQKYQIAGMSMFPAICHGDEVWGKEPGQHLFRNQIVVVFDQTRDMYLCKRIIGLPGETIIITKGAVYIDNIMENSTYLLIEFTQVYGNTNQWKLGEEEYFVLGDNRQASSDSRDFGPIKKSQIKSVLLFKYTPFKLY